MKQSIYTCQKYYNMLNWVLNIFDRVITNTPFYLNKV